jgi:hypothetical protein
MKTFYQIVSGIQAACLGISLAWHLWFLAIWCGMWLLSAALVLCLMED